MAKLSCFSALVGKKKKSKKGSFDGNKGDGTTFQEKLEQLVNYSSTKKENSNLTSFDVTVVPFGIQGDSICKVKVIKEEKSTEVEAAEAAAYDGSDEHDESLSLKRDLSDFDLQAQVVDNGEETDASGKIKKSSFESPITEMNPNGVGVGVGVIESGHVSDPGMGRTAFWGSPKLKRSCSNLETRAMLKKTANQLPPSKSRSFEDLQDLTDSAMRGEKFQGTKTSPLSVITSCSADRVMLKRRSSSQVLPSRSKRLWWKLFLWSHRNLHNPEPGIPKPKQLSVLNPFNRKDGYTSDTLEPSRAQAVKKNKGKETDKLESPGSLSVESMNNNNYGNQSWDKFHGRASGLWPQTHWVAFRTESSPRLSRVDEWVKSLETPSIFHVEQDDGEEENAADFVCPASPERGESPRTIPQTPLRSNLNLSEEALQANNVIQSLNSLSTIAHIASMGLKVIPNMSPFTSLRSVNLSGNFIVHINPGSLPKGLHTLDLSRNKIAAIEGLRELTKLRVLDLSYNRISRIGHGLSNCTIIKELHLAGNKISEVEGLHRLLKLTVLDLSFNKLTTAKALGQLVANYHSLLALNLLGNPIQSNIGDDQLRKTVSSLLPHLTYLNKQPIKPQRAREVATDSVARAALGNSSWNSRRKASRRVTQGSSSSRSRISEVGHRSRHKSKNNHHGSPSTRK
eukprot:TRINITY_DN7163_c0_g1_i1.p1 TRINITY_DN7163_c0_g1~~TRINITY_DN7163_c0_g1_i1.p1  ORF type:complete len:682 (-),score=144.18 TRINITY_DN7163_c0_g1_i1:873-2918(-)